MWFKNFAVGTLARHHGAVAVNLLIDTDTLKHSALPVPGGLPAHCERRPMAMDLADRPIPFEERRILDRRRLRELTFHPELYWDRHATGLEEPGALVAAKQRWIAAEPTPRNARRRFLEIRRINRALQPWVAWQREHLSAAGHRVDHALSARSILHWREYAFCLYPEKTLRNFLCGLLPKSV